jgi:hypothetical protein
LLLTDLSSAEPHPAPVYGLIANVIHESVAGTTRDKENTVWKVQLRAGNGENEKWFQIQDLIVEEIRKEMIFLGETVIQVPISPHDHPIVADHSLSRSGNASNPQWKFERDGSVQTMYFRYASKLTFHLACCYRVASTCLPLRATRDASHAIAPQPGASAKIRRYGVINKNRGLLQGLHTTQA